MIRRFLLAALALVAATPAWADELVHDFRGAKLDRDLLRFENQQSSDFIKPEEEGLRWRFEPGKIPKGTPAVAWRHQARGDFTLTARYEILEVKQPAGGTGVGVELYLMMAGPAKQTKDRDGIPMTRLWRPKGPMLSIQQRFTNAEGVRESKHVKFLPTTPATERGRLRLAREGPTLIASYAEGDAEAFQELHRFEIGAEDVALLRFAGQTGGDPNASLDMRLLEFRLQADEFGLQGKFTKSPPGAVGQAGVVNPPPVPEPPPPPRSNRFVVWGAVLGGLIVIGGIGALLTRLRRKTVTPAVGAATDMLAFACAKCGKSLKVKPDMAGKRVKCPGCGQAVAAPV